MKVVASKQLRLAVETEGEERARLENDAATKRLRLAMEMDEERKARLEKMVAIAQLVLALIKCVVNVGVVSSLKPFLKSWQLCSYTLILNNYCDVLKLWIKFISVMRLSILSPTTPLRERGGDIYVGICSAFARELWPQGWGV